MNKVEIYIKIKQGKGSTTLSKKYGIKRQAIYYLESLIDRHGFEILKQLKIRCLVKGKNKKITGKYLKICTNVEYLVMTLLN